MILINFKVSDDNIGIESSEGRYFDLHNNFEILDFKYLFHKRYFEINFVKSKGKWVSKEDPEKFRLIFKNVQILRLKELDQNDESLIQFPEDDKTVSIIGYTDTKDKDFLGVLLNHEANEDIAITLQTENGQCLIVYSKTAELEITQ